MQIAQILAGYSLGSADLLRRAMGKKIAEEMDKQRQVFVEGAVERSVDRGKASHIFDLVAKFAGYGFNKSHAAAYAVVAYQTAWMKANHPVAFFAALMSLDVDHPDKISVLRRELNRLGIVLLPPDVNASEPTFAVERQPDGALAIRYGLAAVKNVGAAAMEALVAVRREGGPFQSLMDLAGRIDPAQINRRQLENLARSGAIDSLEPNRRAVFEAAESVLRHAGGAAEDRASGQIGLFGQEAAAAFELRLPAVEEWSPLERLAQEFEALGVYLSAHPLQAYERVLKRVKAVRCADLDGEGLAPTVTMAGTVTAKKERTSARGSRYAFVELSDASGTYEVTVFSEQLTAYRELLEPGSSLVLKVNVQADGESRRLTAQSIEALDEVVGRTPADVTLAVVGSDALPAIHRVLNQAGPGRGRVRLNSWLDCATEVEVVLPGDYAIDATTSLRLRQIDGVAEVREV